MRLAAEMDRRAQQRGRKIRLHRTMQAFVDASIAGQRHAAQRDLHQQVRRCRMPGLLRTQQPLRRGLRRSHVGNAVQPHPRVFDLRFDKAGFGRAQMPLLRIGHPLRFGQRHGIRESVFGRAAFGGGLQPGQRRGRTHSCDSSGSHEMARALKRCHAPVSGSFVSNLAGVSTRSSQRGLPCLSRCIQ